MAFTVMLTNQFEIIEGATAGTGGRTTTFRTNTIRADGCDRRNMQVHKISNDVSGTSIPLFPLGATSQLASNLLFLLQCDHPVDVQLGSAGVLSAVRNLLMACTFSALLITTNSNQTTVLTELIGGSGAVITATLPLS